MSLILPVFKNTACVSLTACGEIKNANPQLRKWMKEHPTVIAAIGSGSEKALFRASFGGGSGSHLHIDMTKQSMYRKPNIPKKLNELGSVQESLSRFIGLEVETEISGRFEINISDLPESGIIRSMLLHTKTGDVAIKVAGAVLSITGAPVNAISWVALKDGKTGITVEASNVKTKVTEDYLTSAFERIESALNVFVLGKTTSNEQKK
jgi:hypothetical protein